MGSWGRAARVRRDVGPGGWLGLGPGGRRGLGGNRAEGLGLRDGLDWALSLTDF